MFKILGRFVNTTSANEKYYLVNRDNFVQHIQIALSKKQKNFLGIFFFIFEIYIKF